MDPTDIFDSNHNPSDTDRVSESEEIELRLSAERDLKNARRTMSPEYLASLPKSMIEKLRVTPEEQEEILFHYATTSSLPKTALATHLPLDKIRAVVYSPQFADQLGQIRDALRVSVIQKIEETQIQLLEAIQDPTKLANASLTQISSVFSEISETQLNLLRTRSEIAGSSAVLANPSELFSGDELEYMAFLRRRVTSPSPSPLSSGQQTGRDGVERADRDEFAGHELIDTSFTSSSSSSEETFDLEPAALRDPAGLPGSPPNGGEEEAFGHLEDWELSS